MKTSVDKVLLELDTSTHPHPKKVIQVTTETAGRWQPSVQAKKPPLLMYSEPTARVTLSYNNNIEYPMQVHRQMDSEESQDNFI